MGDAVGGAVIEGVAEYETLGLEIGFGPCGEYAVAVGAEEAADGDAFEELFGGA